MANMRISLLIRYILAFSFLWAPAASWAASVTLRWQANSEPDIAGYNLYYGTASRDYGPPIPTGNTTSYTVDNLDEGRTYYFALTALDTSGNESGYSSEISANATSSEPATEDYTLLLSYNSNRSNAVKLSGQSISGDVYIYINPEAYVSQVVFSIDGQTHNTENYAPYDVGMPFDTTSLSNGSHTVSALVRLQDGSTETVNATCSVLNQTSTDIESGSIPLPASDAYGRIKNGDQTHVNEVRYSFAGMSGDVTLSYRVWDMDFSDEVRIYVNGTPVGYAPKTRNESWSSNQSLIISDNLVIDSGTNTVVFTNTYNPPNTYYWGVGNVSVAVASDNSTPVVSENDGSIALPSSDSYGRIKNGDQTHANEVRYSFAGMSGNVRLSYRVWDIDVADEVRISVNGTPVGYAPKTRNESWSGDQSLTISDDLVNDSGTNIVVFTNTYNPPNTYYWGVGNVSVAVGSATSTPVVIEDDGSIALPSSDSYGRIKNGDQTHVNEVRYSFAGMSGNVRLSYRVWDMDFSDEVRIYVNGTPVGYAPKTRNESWSGDQSLTIPDNLVNNSSTNTVVFKNTYNPPNTYWWGVRDVSVQ